MKLKSNKTIQKIIIILTCLVSFNFIVPTHVSNAGLGGVLFNPIKELFLTVADVVMDFMQMGFTGKWENVVIADVLDGDYSETNLWSGNDDEISLPNIKLSPDAIFSDKVEILNIDFINPIQKDKYDIKSDATTAALTTLRKVIASWYVAVRNLALVAMLSILIYVGIRIIVSSAASDKAKYKQMLMDWVVGMCLLFMLHYVMSFTIFITKQITSMVSSATQSIELWKPESSDVGENDGLKRVNKSITFNKNQDYYDENGNPKKYSQGEELTHVPSLINYVRFYAQMGGGVDQAVLIGATYLIIYIILIVYTVMFAFKYMKRVITIAFLTMIAPFVAMTYPLDKMADGKAQAFNMWLKEYIFNALLQPFHLILYSMLVGASVELAKANIIFAIVAIGFLIPAEKLLKKMFGFDKAITPPGLAGLAATAGVSSMFNKAMSGRNKASSGGGAQNKSNSNGPQGGDNSRVRTQDYDLGGPENNNLENGGDLGEGSAIDGLEAGAAGAGAGAAALGDIDTPQDNSTNELLHEQNRQLDNNAQQELDAFANSSAYGGQGKDNLYGKPKGSALSQEYKKYGNKAKGVARNAGKLAKHAGKKIANPRNLKKGAKFIAKSGLRLAGAAGLGMTGLAIGAATGDFSKAMSLAGAGLAAGNRLGSKAGDAIGSAIDKVPEALPNAKDKVSNFKNEALYGKQQAYEMEKQRIAARQAKQYAKNSDNREFFEKQTGATGSQLNEVMNQAATYNAMGIEDNDTILQAMELEQSYKNSGVDDEMAHKLAGTSAQMIEKEGWKASDFADDKKRQAIENRTKQIVENYAPNLNEKQQEQMTKQLMSGSKYMSGATKRDKDTRDQIVQDVKTKQRKAEVDKNMEKMSKQTQKFVNKYEKNPDKYRAKYHKQDQRRKKK